ncbi:hypothetical protein SAMN05444422_11257 [Halobiforma haloterrestris]|uniref:Uncharacterized protein n=1 Tax=Natronobacterium haloterrestre TaxID=148448 RepID=A0A1I1KMV7_NATHA|nr:hypothetical protein SAMN05444422_11257 [Halobiforma haloterrestris]
MLSNLTGTTSLELAFKLAAYVDCAVEDPFDPELDDVEES